MLNGNFHVYNAEHKLRKCIKSILKQTVKNIELILVADDALPQTALEKSYTTIKEYDVDLACGRIERKWKIISIPSQFVQKCYQTAPLK